ncbi:MAG TPA: hypothetical protein VG078_10100, partial [Acidimicrobiales bacterium]|nr:hypothetical protein [Acidimicrobiales bacterium]
MPKRLILPRVVALAAAAVLVTGALGDAALAAPPDQSDFVEVFGRDLYVLAGASLVNPDAETHPGEQLYNVVGLALSTPAGDDLTWGDWGTATATSRAASGNRSGHSASMTCSVVRRRLGARASRATSCRARRLLHSRSGTT